VLLYRDVNHLTPEGVVWLRPVLEPAVVGQLKSARNGG
jgi:hypothetical protein